MKGLLAAQGIRTVLEAEAELVEAARTLMPNAVEAPWDSGLMTYMNPTEAGGTEPGFRGIIETWIELASADGAEDVEISDSDDCDQRHRGIGPTDARQ